MFDLTDCLLFKSVSKSLSLNPIVKLERNFFFNRYLCGHWNLFDCLTEIKSSVVGVVVVGVAVLVEELNDLNEAVDEDLNDMEDDGSSEDDDSVGPFSS